MVFSLFYAFLAASGLGLLIFIHEFGHYWMARRAGMVVEVFSIGFGKPFFSWERNGVKWQLCWLPFGGYVRIAGMDKQGALEPYQIPDGFYGKSPWARIKVALAGPGVNIAFAFFAFCLLWVLGGRSKPFSEYTQIVGYVDPASAVFQSGVRPGDAITQINQQPFHGFQDFLYAAVLDDRPSKINFLEIDYLTKAQTPLQYQFPFTKHTSIPERIESMLALRPASYLIYRQETSLKLDAHSPMEESGIEDGDRILWVDGQGVFSREQLIETLNQPQALLTIQRKGAYCLFRVPRMKISDIFLAAGPKAELEDWQHEADIVGRLQSLSFIPYHLSRDGVVLTSFTYLNEEALEQGPRASPRAPLEAPLLPGDKIVAVDGMPVRSVYDILELLQVRHIQILVKRSPTVPPVSWKDSDKAFFTGIRWEDVNQIAQSIGTPAPIKSLGNLRMLNPVLPKPFTQLSISEAKRQEIEKIVQEKMKQISEMQDDKQREEAAQALEQEQNRLRLGIVMTDLPVLYNPSPVVLFGNVFRETWKTIVALFSGTITPKYMTGPVGIVHVMQERWGYGFKEALFWLGMISMNLGILNLLPIPVLDGGHVCFSVWEWTTGKHIRAKTMERFIVPFVVLLISLFVYLTYHDLLRIFKGLFH